ncbi:hypothetical protein MHU86_7781 [Fragilaria crotonensis]|nr:hypothetical protein MHU86_7781 [Fragilaria crotonensis]
MTESTMEKLIMKLCFGDEDDNNDVVCFDDQFLLGVNKFKGIFGGAAGSPVQGAADMSLDAVLCVPQILHRQGISIFLLERAPLRKATSKSPSQTKPQLQEGQC